MTDEPEPPTPQAIVEKALSDWYAAKALKRGNPEAILAGLRAAIDGDPQVKAIAQQRLNAVKGIEEKRCFISKTHRDLLNAALAG